MKVVIVGGVAGGASAAARLRRLREDAEIIMFERTGYVSYANCGLPYYVGGTITEESALTLQTPQSFRARFRIDARVRHEVLAIDRAAKQVLVRDLVTGREFAETYDKLVLAPGARPVIPAIPGADDPRVYTLRTVEDTFRLREKAAVSGMRSAVIVGGGFIGLEMAENLRGLGLAVTIIERNEQVLTPLDADMASFLHAHLREQGVALQLGDQAAEFVPQNDGLLVKTAGGAAIPADMVLLAIGVQPESDLARAAGLELGVRGTIAVDEHMRTSDPDIYAVGDAVQVKNRTSGEMSFIPLAGPANREGRVAADNIAGIASTYPGSVGSSVLKVFAMTAACTGLNERAAKRLGLDYAKVILSPASHAGYYPGGRVLNMKVLFDPVTERILGGQIVGFDGVDKRIDVLATAMQAGLKVRELKDLDLAYAPPYSSARDPINMAGMIAENVLAGRVRQFFYEDIRELAASGAQLIDVRTVAEYARGHAAGFDQNIPLHDLREHLAEIDVSRPVYVMCQAGLRSYIACRILTQHGFDCYNFAGGYRYYAAVRDGSFDALCRTDCGQN